MKHLTFYFDVISPYAFLALEALPEFLRGHSHSVTYKPILFAALLKHHGQLGPAEIAGKREWTYRQVQWLAQRQNISLQMTATHPFNPLGWLRLAVACATPGDSGDISPNRYVCETIFRHVWQGGADAADAARLAELTKRLAPARVPDSDEVKATLKSNCDEAIAHGVFGVPTIEVDGKLFWGLDALPMLRDYLKGEAWFQTDAWEQAAKLPIGQARRQVTK
jgi:2-hydroxychromene-2-carboxylate isomerase